MHHQSAQQELKVLEEAGFSLDTGMCTTEEDLIEKGKGVHGFLVSYAPVTRKVMEALPDLKVMVKYGIGVDNIDVSAATDLGKVVANVPDASSEEVAVHALSLLLAGFRNTLFFQGVVKSGRWEVDPEPYIPFRLSQVSLGIIGFGRIPRVLARIAKPLFQSVHVYDPFVASDSVTGAGCVAETSLEALFAHSTAVSVHVPLTELTRGAVDSALIRRSPGLILVNTSRGGVVDMQSVVDTLKTGELKFFGSDVFWTEPPNFDDSNVRFLLEQENVVITPHVAWCSQSSAAAVRRSAAEEAKRVLLGQKPRNTVNPEVFKKMHLSEGV